MGFFFKSSEEKELKQRKKDEIIESGASYMGYATTNIGPILKDSVVTIKMYPKEQKVTLSASKDKLDLPYNRILGFSINEESVLSSGKISLSGAIIGGALLGPVGATVGALSKKNKNKVNWIGTLLYESKEGEQRELTFLTYALGSPTKKTFGMEQFETAMNKVASRRIDKDSFEL